MTNTVIKIEGLGKKYLLAHKSPQRYIALRDVLVERARRLGRGLRHPFAKSAEEGKSSCRGFLGAVGPLLRGRGGGARRGYRTQRRG